MDPLRYHADCIASGSPAASRNATAAPVGTQPLLRNVPEGLVSALHQAVLELPRFEMA